ncbi:MAG: hypothetical protein WD490_10895 [Opitutales bacterium]
MSVDEYYACVGEDAAKAEWKAERAPDYPGIRERFVTAIVGAKLTGPTFEDGLAAQSLIECSFRSALQSNWVKVDYYK